MAQPSVKPLINDKEKKFKDSATFQAYINNEIAHWKWLQEIQGNNRGYTAEIYNIFFFSKLRPLLDRFEESHPNFGEFSLGSASEPYIESTSKEGLLIQKTRESYGDITAAFLIIYITQKNRNIIFANGNLRTFTEVSGLAYEKAVAIQIAVSNDDTTGLIKNSKIQALNKVLEKFTEDAESSLENINDQQIEIENHIKSVKENINHEANGIQRSFKRRNKVYRRYASKFKNEAAQSLDDAKHRLDSAKAAYDDQVDLDASVQYWINRKKNHSKFKFLWFLAIIASMTFTFSSLLTYYSFGGAAGISKYIHTQADSIAPNPEAKNPTPSSVAAPTTATPLLLGQTKSELSLAIADIAGAALLITLLGVLIRITLRQFNTHSHFALDAAERITFTKTYLALLSEGKLKADEDRRLILESLFRSSQPGSLVEIPFSSPIELILKTLSDKKPSS
ncbi:DUF6161 domain-containing protein [Pseudomonas sp. 58(2021)]|uniref:DUF6161 domain-containing protein n=1 Tax=Pseudomonas sp. 58(2021) TaxID=2813330 RepID=UPI001A9EBCF8|nr:DUF6161 domain-containing protein [Pseudomonas sp. 58(2021)]